MKLLRLIPVCIAATALIAAQEPPASQSQQAAGAATNAEKKTRKKAKKAAEETNTTGTAAVSGTQAMPGEASQAAKTPTTGKAKTSTTGSASRAVPAVSESEIAAARASGEVWVNTETGVYHKGGKWYGATKQGKFMTEDQAIKAGYRASKAK